VKEAVGFFTFVKPPEVEETGRYNRAVGTLWFVAAGIFEKIFPCFGLMKAKTREKIFSLAFLARPAFVKSL